MKKYVRDTVVRNGYEWRIIGALGSPITEVVTIHGTRQFPNSRSAYAYVTRAVRRVADDLQQVQPGAVVQLPFQNSAPKPMKVMMNDPNGITLSDPSTGQQMVIPHLTGAPQVAQPAGGTTNPTQPAVQSQGLSNISPGTGLKQSRRKVAFPPPPSGPAGGAPPSPGGAPAPGAPPAPAPEAPERPELPNQNPELGSSEGRMLTRHEIIQECETLIRNALWRGVRIGTKDLLEYLQQQYSNKPQELYEGAQKAWENVRYEDEELFNRAEGPGPDAPGGGPQTPGMPGAPQHSEPAEWGMDDEEAPPHATIR